VFFCACVNWTTTGAWKSQRGEMQKPMKTDGRMGTP
jgi:hypothetical protein